MSGQPENDPDPVPTESPQPAETTQKHATRRNVIGWGSIAIVGAILAVAANMSEILGWFTPDETRALVEDTRSTIRHTDRKVDELIKLLVNQAAASGMELDIGSEDAIRNAVEAIVVSGNQQKQTALDRVADGDVAGAAEALEKLAATQADAVSVTSTSAADSWVEAAALYESLDIEKAAYCYEQAALQMPGDPQILDSLGHALLTAGRLDEAVMRFEQVLGARPDAATRSSALLGLGYAARRQADYPLAAEYLQQALEVAEDGDATADRIHALRSLGLLHNSRGNAEDGAVLLGQALELAEKHGDERVRALVLSSLGTIAAESGDYAAAEPYYTEALDIYKSRGDLAKQALVTGNLGAMALHRGDFEAAEPFLLESVKIGEQINWQHSIAYDMINLAAISSAREDYAEADERLGRAQGIAEAQGLAELLPVIVFNRGEIAQSAGDMDAACRYWAEAAPVFAEMGSEHASMARETLAAECPGAVVIGQAGE